MWSWRSRVQGSWEHTKNGERVCAGGTNWKMNNILWVDKLQTTHHRDGESVFLVFLLRWIATTTNQQGLGCIYVGYCALMNGGHRVMDSTKVRCGIPPAVLWKHHTESQSTIAEDNTPSRSPSISLSLSVYHTITLFAELNYTWQRGSFPNISIEALSRKPRNNYSFPYLQHGSSLVRLRFWSQKS